MKALILSYLKKPLPEIHSSDRLLLPYISVWASLIMKIRHPLIIGVTGTAGKTTLTQMLGHVLMQDAAKSYVGAVGVTAGNLNGDYGVRLSVLRKVIYPNNLWQRLRLLFLLPLEAIPQVLSANYPKVLVLEYGTYEAGHIQDLVNFAPPKIALLTNIGPAHLERHKTVEGVYIEKRALVQAAPLDGLVVLGSGHEFVSRLKADAKAPVVVVNGRGIILSQNMTRVVCQHLGLPGNVIEEGLNSFIPPKSRLSRFKVAGMTVIDDSYNANPLSMKLGLDILAESRSEGKRLVALLGKMAEMGEMSSHYHREVGIYARKRADLIIGIGKEAKDYAPDHWFLDSEECAEKLRPLLQSEDVVLIKGSYSANMRLIVKMLQDL